MTSLLSGRFRPSFVLAQTPGKKHLAAWQYRCFTQSLNNLERMGRSPLILAALAKAAVPALNFSQVKPQSFNNDGHYDTALLTATNGDHYVLKMPTSAKFALDLDTEMVAIRAIGNELRAKLPFGIPKQIGETKDSRGNRAILLSYVYGDPIDLTRLHATDLVLTSLAGALAAIHELPISVVENSGLPSYTATEVIHENVARLDRAADTGLIPARLLERWEEALEDVNLFRFNPCVIHGDFVGETVLTLDGSVSGVLGWRSLRVSDPAQDLSWIVGAGNQDAAYTVLVEYARLRGVAADENLKQRAALYSELNVADWLVYGLAANDQDVVDSALGQLQQYVADVEQGAAEDLVPRPLGQKNASEFGFAAETDSGYSSGSGFNAAEFMDASQNVVTDSYMNSDSFEALFDAPLPDPSEVTTDTAPIPIIHVGTAELIEEPVSYSFENDYEILEAEILDEPVSDKTGEIRLNRDGELF